MDSAHDFDLLGESVPQVRVSARALVLLGLFKLQFILTPSSFSLYISCLSSLEGGALNRLTGCPLGSRENVRTHLGGRCVHSTCNIFR